MIKALYSGSFDPVTNGHLDIIQRAARLFDGLVIAVGAHHSKSSLLPADERVALLKSVISELPKDIRDNLEVVTFSGLVVDAARQAGASVIVRGLRSGTDLDYEEQMAGMNHELAVDIETVFLSASPEVRHIASSLVKQIAALGGDIRAFVPPKVAERLART